MSEPVKTETPVVTEQKSNAQGATFSPEYIRELREEAASWRTKFREAETSLSTMKSTLDGMTTGMEIEKELTTRGIKGIEPSWITLEKDKPVKDCVDKFLVDHPQFAIDAPPVTHREQTVTRPMKTEKTNTNVQGVQNLDEAQTIKNDPIARAKLRSVYKQLLGRPA